MPRVTMRCIARVLRRRGPYTSDLAPSDRYGIPMVAHRNGKDVVNMAKERTNVIPIIEGVRHPAKYSMLVGMVDMIFSNVAQLDQAKILALSVLYFQRVGGHLSRKTI